MKSINIAYWISLVFIPIGASLTAITAARGDMPWAIWWALYTGGNFVHHIYCLVEVIRDEPE